DTLKLNLPGTTRTHALLPGSPALDAVQFNAERECPAPFSEKNPVYDQRGVKRPSTASTPRCDLGAFEFDTNARPSISDIASLTIDEGTSTPEIPFTVGDAETPAANLVVRADSSDTSLVPNDRIVIGGSGTNRTLEVTPLPSRLGSTVITVVVQDPV